jgi:gamma-glutamylcysteine synthetase
MAITADGIVTVVPGVLQTGGIATFVYFLIRGLRHQILTLNVTVEQQQKTLEVMERRVLETEKFGEMYRRMLADLPADMEKFKEVISHLKDSTIAELKKANQSKGRERRSVNLALVAANDGAETSLG